MAKITERQINTLKSISNGEVLLRGKFDRYWWEGSDLLCTAVARNLRKKGLIKCVYLNRVRSVIKLTDAGISVLQNVKD